MALPDSPKSRTEKNSTQYFIVQFRQQPLKRLETTVMAIGLVAIALVAYSMLLMTDIAKRHNDRSLQSLLNIGIVVILLAFFIGLIMVVRRHRIGMEAKNAALGNRVREKSDRLTESIAFNKAIVERAVDGILTANEHGLLQSVNPAAERIFGYSASELLGQNVSILMPSPYAEQHDLFIQRYLAARMPQIMGSTGREVVAKRKDGTIFPIEIAINEVYLDNQRLFAGILRDITERKKIEKMKDEFISIASHELRTPLTSIRGSLGLLAGTTAASLSPQANELIKIALNNTERLTRLINDILDLEKIEAGQMTFHLQPVELMPLIEQTIDANRGYGEQLGIKFVVVEQADGVKVKVDSDRMVQVMTNLLSNAAKFSPENSAVKVVVREYTEKVRIAVSDEGCGIPQEFKGRIFQKFAQADSSDSRPKGGTGLGLSICKAIIEKMGGEISFQSQINIGTTFYVDLPKVREATREVTRSIQQQIPPVRE